MKTITITLTLLIYTALALATPIEEFAKRVETSTLSNSYFPIKSFENFESNKSINKIKENFETLLPLYFSAKNLFSKEEIKFFNIERPFVQIDPSKEVYTTTIERSAMTYMDFFNILNIYLEYLQQHPSIKNNELLYRLSEKALYDFSQLMHNSSNTLEYIISLKDLKNLYNNINDYSLLKKYPPLKKETLLTRLIQDKDEALTLFKTSSQSVFDDNKSTQLSINLMQECFRISKQKMDKLYENLIEAIKDSSPKAIQKYKVYRETIKYDLTEWQQLQLQVSRTILDVLHYMDLDIGYYFGLPERAAKMMTSTSLSAIDPMLVFWEKNEALIHQYNRLLKQKGFTQSWEMNSTSKTIEALYGTNIILEKSSDINVSIPFLIENPANTPISIKSSIPLKSIALMQDKKPHTSLMAYIKVPKQDKIEYKFNLNFDGQDISTNIIVVLEAVNGKFYSHKQELALSFTCCDGEMMECPNPSNPEEFIVEDFKENSRNLKLKLIEGKNEIKFGLQSNIITYQKAKEHQKPVQFMRYFHAKTKEHTLIELHLSQYASNYFYLYVKDNKLAKGDVIDIEMKSINEDTVKFKKTIP